MRFRDVRTGAILEPSDGVAALMRGDPNLVPVDVPKAKPARRRGASGKKAGGSR